MAVTIESEPIAWQPSDNPLTYEFSSDQTGQPNFSFKVELKINGQTIWTDKIFPEVSNKAHWDVSSIVRIFVSGPTVSTQLIVDSGTTLTIQVVVYTVTMLNHS